MTGGKAAHPVVQFADQMVPSLPAAERHIKDPVRPKLIDCFEAARANVLAQLSTAPQFSAATPGAAGRPTFIEKPDGMLLLSRVNCVVWTRVPDSTSSRNFEPGRENLSRYVLRRGRHVSSQRWRQVSSWQARAPRVDVVHVGQAQTDQLGAQLDDGGPQIQQGHALLAHLDGWSETGRASVGGGRSVGGGGGTTAAGAVRSR